MATVGLSSKLRLELERTNSIFSKWADQQSEWLTTSENMHQAGLEECRFTLAALRDNELQLEELREQNESVKSEQVEEIQRLTDELLRLKMQNENLQPQLNNVTQEEAAQARALEEVHAELETMRKQMEKSLNDLTHGLHMYAALGLEFQKAEGDCMKFIFTQIDRSAPLREFYFLMYVDNNDKYQLVKTLPALDAGHCGRLLDQFNRDNDIGKFVLQIRNGFKRLVAAQ